VAPAVLEAPAVIEAGAEAAGVPALAAPKDDTKAGPPAVTGTAAS
jgi:hypothetical protein